MPILLVFLLYCQAANSQVKYSSSDLLAIKRSKTALQTAEKNWNKYKLYELGVFYEKIYARYKDTSMKSAIHCYKLVTISDGPDYLDEISPKAAYTLGVIYEHGKGVPTDKKTSMIYYFLSGKKKKNNLEKMQQTYCSGAEVMHNSIGKYQLIDSLVLKVSPFCKIRGKASSSALMKVSDFLKVNPSFRISITIAEDARGLPAPYRYWLRDFGLLRHFNYVKNFIMEDQGISGERVATPEINLENDGPSRVTIKILRDISGF